MRLAGKKTLVTGGSRRLGKALVQRFARMEAKTAFCAHSAEALNATAADLHDMGVSVVAQTCDIGYSQQVQKFVDDQAQDRLNIRVNPVNPGPLATEMCRVVHPRGGSETIAQNGTCQRHLYLTRAERSKENFRTVV